MKALTLSLTGLIAAAGLSTGALAQQAPPSGPPTPQVRQRAPGVPLAPRTDMARLRGDQTSDAQTRQQADRSLPMPKGVPSIIAP